MVTVDDCIEAEEVFKEDQGVQRVLRERYGIYDVNEVACDPWYYGQRYSAIPRYYTDLAHVGSGSRSYGFTPGLELKSTALVRPAGTGVIVFHR